MKTFLHSLLLLIAILSIPSIEIKPQIYKWAQSISSSSNITSSAISIDISGNNYITGYFTSTATFGTHQLTSFGVNDIFIAKYDSNGNCIWAVQAGGTSDDYGNSISVDANGNIYITGAFLGTTNFGTFQLTSVGNNGNADIFIAKYDPNGNCLWAKQAGGNNIDYGFGIAADKDGNSYVTGYFRQTAIFGSFQLTSNGLDDIFLAKYDPNGNCLWVKQSGSQYNDIGYGVTVDGDGNGFLTGYFNGTVSFGSIQLTSFGKEDIFISKYDPNGNCIWAEQAGDTASDIGYGIAVDSNGNSFITGEFQRTALFGTRSIISQGDYDIFTAKYDPNGNCLWCKPIGDSFEDRAKSIAVDEIGDCYVTGQINTNGNNDIIMAEYDPYGRYKWIQTAGGTGTDGGLGITAQPNGNIYVTGTFSGSASFGTFQLSGGGSFLTKIYSHNLNITAPIANEPWDVGTSRNITWNSNDDGNIKVEMQLDWWLPWFVLADSINARLGGYTFIVPGDGYFSSSIRLTSLSYNTTSQCPNGFNSASFNSNNLIITSPNIPLIWISGSVQNITWTDIGNVANVKLEYTTNNGIKWRLITNSTSASAQSYSWQIPNLYSKSCRIRITDASNPYLYDVSDELFMISPANQNNLIVGSPRGGESWLSESTQVIKWTSNKLSNINISYTFDAGANWNIISQNVPAAADSFNWKVPITPSPFCKVKIEDASNPSIYSESNNYFIIAPPVSYYPTYNLTLANESHPADNVYEVDVYMLSTDTAAIELAHIQLYVSFPWEVANDVNASWVPGSSELSNIGQIPDSLKADRSSEWIVRIEGGTIPGAGNGSKISNIYPGTRIGRLRLVSSTPYSSTFQIIWHDKYFHTTVYGYLFGVNTLINSTGSLKYYYSKILSITSPIGYEDWSANFPRNITWNSNDGGNIKIEMTTDFGQTWLMIADSVKASLGCYTYYFPNLGIYSSKIKLTSLTNNYSSISPYDFFIQSRPLSSLTITFPNTTVIWKSGNVENITWSLNNSTTPISALRLDYTTDNGISWNIITKSTTASTLHYQWLIPNSISTECRIRVTDKLYNSNYDVSDELFEISPNDNPTPVELTSFTAVANNINVKINWTTATEKNNMGFDVERSGNRSDWVKLGFVKGNGTRTTANSYSYVDKTISTAGKYYYRLQQIDNDGSYKYSKIVEVDLTAPSVFSLDQNYPNPFNPNTIICYSLPLASNVKLIVYNTLGQVVKVLENEFKNAGNYSINFNATELPSGTYFYKIEAGQFSQIKKMMLLK